MAYSQIPAGFPAGWAGKYLSCWTYVNPTTYAVTLYWGVSIDGLKFYELPHPIDSTAFVANANDHPGLLQVLNGQPVIPIVSGASGHIYLMKMIWGANWLPWSTPKAFDPNPETTTQNGGPYDAFFSNGVATIGSRFFSLKGATAPTKDVYTGTDTTPIVATTTLVPGAPSGSVLQVGASATTYIVTYIGTNASPSDSGPLNTYYTSSDSKTWTAQNRTGGFNKAFIGTSQSRAVYVCNNSNGTNNVVETTLDGLTFSGGLSLATSGIVTAACSPTSIVVGADKVYRSTDGGATFTSYAFPNGSGQVSLTKVGRAFFAAQYRTVSGVGSVANYASLDDGATWTFFDFKTAAGSADNTSFYNMYSDDTTWFFPSTAEGKIYTTTNFVAWQSYGIVTGDIPPGQNTTYIPGGVVVAPVVSARPYDVMVQLVVEVLTRPGDRTDGAITFKPN